MAMDIPMFHFDVRPVPQPYQSPYVQSMAQLIGAGDRYQADAIQQSAAARARGVENIGHEVGGTLMDYAKYELAQRSPVVQLQKLKVQKELEDMADDDLIQKTVAANGGDVDKALGTLRQSGNVSVTAISKLQKMADDSRNAALKSSHDTLTYKSDILKQAGQMYPEAPAKPDDPDQVSKFTSQYAEVYPSLVSTVGPQFAPNLPKPDDPDLVNKVDVLRKWGLSASEAIRLQTAGLAKIAEARREKEDVRKANDADQKGISLRLSTAQNQDDWNTILTESKAQGVDPSVLARFPVEFSPKAVNTARVLASGKPDEPGKPGTLENYIEEWAKEHNTTADKIASPELLKLRKDYAVSGHIFSVAAGDIPDDKVNDYVKVITENPAAYRGLTETMKSRLMVPLAKAGFKGFDAPTQANVISANNARTRELNKIDRDVTQKLMTPAEAEPLRQRVEANYKLALGQAAPAPPVQAPNLRPILGDDAVVLPPTPVPPGTRGAAPLPAVAPPTETPTPASTTPAPASAPARQPGSQYVIPPPMGPEDVLKGLKPGYYKLTDGTKWKVNRDGSIVKAPK